MNLNLWMPANHFRLLIVHSSDATRLADELARQLPEFGFACSTLSRSIEIGRADALLNTMDGMILLLTPKFLDDPICNQAGGFAMGRGVHLRAIHVSAPPRDLFQRVPTLPVPTDSALPRLIAQVVARDPLSSQRFSTGAVKAVARRTPSSLVEHLACLESLQIPSNEAIVELERIRQAMRGEIERSAELRLDRLMERWQAKILDEAL